MHRSSSDPISNDEIISSFVRDFERWAKERPPIRKPDAIIVSGDLIQGAPLGTADYQKVLSAQYEESFDLIARLASEFLSGDHSKVVIVPGNHDVDWNTAVKSVTVVNKYDDEIPSLLNLPNSPYRWSWKDLCLYRIIDIALYGERLAIYNHHVEQFYKGIMFTASFDSNRGWNIHTFLENRIAIVGFNSCFNNDCYRSIGEITARVISQAHLELRKILKCKLSIAVWHHSLQGSPYSSDFMDASITPLLIDRGVGLALHGHQHKPAATPYTTFLSDKKTMVVVSGGTLCAGRKALPMGQNRSFNVIQIDDTFSKGTLHIREMISQDVFGPARVALWGGLSFTEIEWNATPRELRDAQEATSEFNLNLIEETENLIQLKNYEQAIDIIDKNSLAKNDYGNKLLKQALFEGEKWERLVEELQAVKNNDELAKKAIAFMKLKRWPDCEDLLDRAIETETFSPPLIKELSLKMRAEKGASK